MIARFIVIFAVAMTGQSFAKDLVTKRNPRKPNQVEALAIHFEVVYGEKTTYFQVVKTKNGGRVDFSNNLGAKDSKDISAGDYEFLKTKVARLTGLSNKKEFCNRKYVEVTDGTRQVLGCLGAPNKLAVEIQKIVNLISLLF